VRNGASSLQNKIIAQHKPTVNSFFENISIFLQVRKIVTFQAPQIIKFTITTQIYSPIFAKNIDICRNMC
jgi:hypothetical protein